MARKLSNSPEAAQLLSLKNIKMSSEIPGCDRNGPYVVMQHAYDPDDPAMVAEDYLLGKSGAWLATKWFIGLPVPQRRAEYVFATSTEVISLLESLVHGVQVVRPGGTPPEAGDGDPLGDFIRSGGKGA